MLKIAVCDDDKAAITGLSQAIKNAAHELSEPVEIHTFSNGNELLNSGSKYNLILLDIEMPGTDGIKIAEKIRTIDSHVQIVYVTNYRDYMKKAYSVHAFDYIQKPITYDSIKKVFDDYLKIINPTKGEIIEFTSIYSEQLFISSDDIIYISCGAKKRTLIVITQDLECVCKGKITDILSSLNSNDFFMPHRSHIINLSFVKSFRKSDKITMINGDEIPLSKGNSTDFERQLARKMHEKANWRML